YHAAAAPPTRLLDRVQCPDTGRSAMSMVAEREGPQRRAVAVLDGFDPVASIGRLRAVEITVVDEVPGEADAVAFPVDAAGAGAEALGADAAGLASAGNAT